MKRMTRLLLIHWHYFSHEVIEFDTINFLTGKNAAGKSTIMDALQLILLCDTTGTYFNKAASSRGTRSLNGYLRGELGDNEDSGFKCLRSGRFTSYIVLEFYDEEKKVHFTAGCCFDTYSENDVQKLLFRYDGPLPQHEFVEERKPMDIAMLRSFIKENYTVGHSYTTDVNRDFRQDLYGKMGGLRDRFGQLLRKAVSFNPNVEIQQFISEFVCDSQQIVDVSLMQENIRSYKSLEKEADVLKQKIKLLDDIMTTHQDFESHRRSETLYGYLLDQAKVEIKLEALTQEQQRAADLSSNIVRLTTTIKEAEDRREALQKERDQTHVQLVNNEQEQALERLQTQIGEKELRVAALQAQFDKTSALLQRSSASWREGIAAMLQGIETAEFSTMNPLLAERIQALMEEGRQFSSGLQPLFWSDADTIRKEGNEGLRHIAGIADNLRISARELASRLTEEQQRLAGCRKELLEEEKSLERGVYRFPQDALDLKEAVSSHLRAITGLAIKVVIVAEAVEVRDPRWRNAIEGYLHTQKFYLIVPPEHVGVAIDIYDKIKQQKSLYGTGVVDTYGLSRKNRESQRGSLAEEMETADRNVRLFLDYALGHVIKCDHVDRIRENRTSITDEGLLYQNFVVSAINPGRWAKPALGLEAIRQRLEDVKWEIADLTVLITSCAIVKTALPTGDGWQTLSPTDLEQIVAAARDIELLPALALEIARLRESLTAVDRSVVDVLKQRIQELEATLKELQEQISNQYGKKGELTASLDNCEQTRIPAMAAELSDMKVRLTDNYNAEWVETTGFPRYQRELLSRGNPVDIDRAFPRELTRVQNSKDIAWENLKDLRRQFNEKYIMGYDIHILNNEEYENAWLEFSEIKLPEYSTRIADARNKAFEEFQEDFLSRLQNNIREAQRQIDELNEALRGIPFGEDTYRFRMIPNPEYKRYYLMIVDPMLLEGGYNLLSVQFNAKYKDEIAELFAIITNDAADANARDREDYEKRVQAYTDYRTYLSFDLEVMDREGGSQRLSKTMGKKSGGETQTPFYVAVLASFAQLYRVGRERNASTARIILFDEAFSKMDGERIMRSMELLRKFQFQVVLSAPPDKIADIATLVDRNLCVLREGKHVCVRSFDPKEIETEVLDELA